MFLTQISNANFRTYYTVVSNKPGELENFDTWQKVKNVNDMSHYYRTRKILRSSLLISIRIRIESGMIVMDE